MDGFNIFSQRLNAMYDIGFRIYCNWSRLKPGLISQHTEVSWGRWTWYPTRSHYTDTGTTSPAL